MAASSSEPNQQAPSKEPPRVDINPTAEQPSIQQILDRHALEADRPERGMPRVALGIAGEPHARSLVAAGELITMRDDATTTERLNAGGWRPVDASEVCDDVFRWRKRFEPDGTEIDPGELPARAHDVTKIIRQLRSDGLSVSTHRAFVAGGIITKKGLNADEPELSSAAHKEWQDLSKRCAEHPPTVGNVRVVVIDTGIHEGSSWADHGLLASVPASAANADPLDAIGLPGQRPDGFLDHGAGHGTVVTGLVRKFAPDVPVIVVRALDSDGIGFEALIACAIRRAAAQADADGIDHVVFNLSFGMYGGEDDTIPYVLDGAIRSLDPDRHMVVSSAGNASSPRESYPAALPEVIAVGSIDDQGRRSSFSSYGWWVDVAAVGERVVSSFVPGEENPDFVLPGATRDAWEHDFPLAICDGTSFATPKVAATAARLLASGASPREAATAIKAAGPSRKGLGTILHDDLLHAIRL
jgi:subtilisin family serine protease